MNRANFGNIITNGVQTLSVAGFTGSNWKKGADRARKADAASGLNNLSDEEAGILGEARADGMRQQIAENIESKLGDNVDAVMDEGLFERLRSPQAKQLKQKVNADLDWYKNYRINRNTEERIVEKGMTKILKKEQALKVKRGDK